MFFLVSVFETSSPLQSPGWPWVCCLCLCLLRVGLWFCLCPPYNVFIDHPNCSLEELSKTKQNIYFSYMCICVCVFCQKIIWGCTDWTHGVGCDAKHLYPLHHLACPKCPLCCTWWYGRVLPFLSSSPAGHVSVFVMNSVAVSTHDSCTFLWTYGFISLGCRPRISIAGSHGNCMFNSGGDC